MDIRYGAEVIDKNGKRLGKVNHLMQNTWSGETSKFLVRQEDGADLFLGPEDVQEASDTKIVLRVAVDEPQQS